MLTGQLNKQVTIRSYTVSTLASGQKQKSWSDLITLFANVRYETGIETNQANQKVAVKSIVVTIYKGVATITEQNLLVFENQTYAILAVTPVDDEFYLELKCERRDNNNVQ